MKKTEDNTNKWKETPCSGLRRITIVKMFIPPKEIYRFNTVLIKTPMAFFTELEQIILTFVWNHKRPQVFCERTTNNFEKEQQSWRCCYLVQADSTCHMTGQ